MPPADHAAGNSAVELEVSPELPTDELRRKLQEVSRYLQDSASLQDTPNKPDAASPKISKKLTEHYAQDAFLQHSDKHVRALVAVCLAELFRIFVGTADDEMASQGVQIQLGPLSDLDVLQGVMEFFIEQLGAFLSKSSQYYALARHVIHVMGSTRAFTLIFNIDEHQKLLEDLISMFFHVIRDKHTASDRLDIVEILSGLLGDSEAMISHPILQTLLHPLTPDAKRMNSATYALARELLQRIAKQFEPCIGSYFLHLMTFDDAAEAGDIRDNFSNIMLELFIASPQLISSSLRVLEALTCSSVMKERIEGLILIGQIVSSDRYSQASQADQDILYRLASARLNDVEEKVRCIAIETAKKYIVCCQKIFEDKARIKEYVDLVGTKMLDNNAVVRSEAIKAICEICLKVLDAVSLAVVEEISERIKDKDANVRGTAITSITDMLKKFMYGNDTAVSTEKVRLKIGPRLLDLFDSLKHIPQRELFESRISWNIIAYGIGQKDHHEIGLKDYQQAASHLIYFFVCARESGLGFLEELFINAMKYRQVFINCIKATDDAAKNKHKQQLIRLFSIGSLNLGQIVREVCVLIQTDLAFRQQFENFLELKPVDMYKSMEDLVKISKWQGAAATGLQRICQIVIPFRLNLFICSAIYSTVHEILRGQLSQAEHLCHNIGVPIQPDFIRQRSSRLLQFIAKFLPRAFACKLPDGSTKLPDKLLDYWSDRDLEVSVNVHRFFAHCAQDISSCDTSNKFTSLLKDKALEFKGGSSSTSDPTQVKMAIRCLNDVSRDLAKDFDELTKWAVDILANDPEDGNCIPAVVALGEIAACTGAHGPHFHSGSSQEVRTPALDNSPAMNEVRRSLIKVFEHNVLPSITFENLEPQGDEDEWASRGNLSNSVLYVVLAMKAIGKFARCYKLYLPKSNNGISAIVRKIVDKLKAVVDDESEDLDILSQDHLLLTAAMQLLKTVPEMGESTFDLCGLITVIPRLNHGEAVMILAKLLMRMSIGMDEPGPYIAIASSAAVHAAPSTIAFRDHFQEFFKTVYSHLRLRVEKNAHKFEMSVPELTVIYLIIYLCHDKEFVDPDRLPIQWLEKHGSSIYCLIDALVSDNAQFSPGILASHLRLAKHSHVTDNPGPKSDKKLHILCDYALAILDKRVPNRSPPPSDHVSQIPCALATADDNLYPPEGQPDAVYFNWPISIARRADGTARVNIASCERSASRISRDSDGKHNGKGRASGKRTRISRSASKSQGDASSLGGDLDFTVLVPMDED